MAIGDLAYMNFTLGSGAQDAPAMSEWTTTDGSSLTSSDAVVVRSVIHEDDVSIERETTSGVTYPIVSRKGEGEFHSMTSLYTTSNRVSVLEEAGLTQDVILIGEQVDPANVWEFDDEVALGTTEYTSPAVGEERYVMEVTYPVDFDMFREFDFDDDGTYEYSNLLLSNPDGVSLQEVWLAMPSPSGRTNPLSRIGIENKELSIDGYMWGTTI